MPAIERPEATAQRFAERFGLDPVSAGQALAAGFSRGQLRAAAARGLLDRPRHGVLRVASVPATGDEHERRRTEHLLAITAALAAVGGRAHATEQSAAMVLGLPLPTAAAPSRVSLVRPGVSDSDGPGLRLRGTEIPPHFLTEVDGVPVTDVRRTAIDLARGRTLPRALETLDAAARHLIAGWTGATGNDLRRAALDGELRRRASSELQYALGACTGYRGVVAVRRALPHVDPAAESPLESRSRGWFLQAGLTLLVGQPITIGRRTYWADFLDEARKVVGEADGWGKYGTTPEEIRRAIAAEKERQAELEADGYRFVRWGSGLGSAAVVARMRAALRSD